MFHISSTLFRNSNAEMEGVNFFPPQRADVSTLIIDGELHRKAQFRWCCPALIPAAAGSAAVGSSSPFLRFLQGPCVCKRERGANLW